MDKSALPVFKLWGWKEKELVSSGDLEQTGTNIVENHGDI
jgi:hypothetical protein